MVFESLIAVKKLYIFIIISFLSLTNVYGQQPYYSYTFQVNQTCTSCCTATACISFTYNCSPVPPIGGYALITATTTTPTWTLNPCFYNLCNGNYTVLINGVPSNDACMICIINQMFPSQPTGLKEIRAQEDMRLFISPNPAKEQIQISYYSELMNESEVHIINLLGQKLKKLTFQKEASSTICNVSDLGPGIYFVVVSNKDKMLERKKLIISD